MIQSTSSKFSLPKKLYVFFGAVCLSLSIIGTTLMFQKNKTFDSLNEQNTAFNQMSSFSNAPGYVDSIALAAMDAIVDAGSFAVEKDLVEEVDKGVTYFQENKKEIYAVFKAAGKEKDFQGYEKSLSELTKATQALFDEIPRKPSESVLAEFDNKIDSNATIAKNILSDVKASFEGVVSAGREKANSDISFMSTFSLSLSVCCFILVMALGVPLVRSIINPLKKISDMLNGSSGILERISESLVSTSNELNDVTAQQSSAVQESVASIAEISATISQTSEHARESSQQAQIVMGKTEIGAQVMEKMVNSMNSIQSANSQLQNIAKIINEINQKTNVINDIVFKTQLLAFNASIEAARAGQHGRGFAVVANEVGNLAQLSGNAANQIQSLLEDSKSQVSNILQLTESRVQEGQSVCREAKTSFEDMFQSIRKIVEQMQSISDAAVEQDVGVKQTTDAMGLIDVSSRKVHQVAIEATRASTDVKLQCKQISKITFEVIKMVGAVNTNEHSSVHPEKFDKIKKTQQSLASFDADDDSFKDAA